VTSGEIHSQPSPGSHVPWDTVKRRLRPQRHEEETYASGAPVDPRVNGGYQVRVGLVVERFFATIEEAMAWMMENSPDTWLGVTNDRDERDFRIRQLDASIQYRGPGQSDDGLW
jgi:hypothetical protein